MEIYTILNGKKNGPFSKEQLISMLVKGTISENDLIWHEGLMQAVPFKSSLISEIIFKEPVQYISKQEPTTSKVLPLENNSYFC